MQSASQPYTCNICGMVLINSEELSEHEIAVHIDKIFQCQSCNKLFVSKREFENHTTKVHGDSQYTTAADHNNMSTERVLIEETDDEEMESMLLERVNEEEKARKRTRGPYRKASSSFTKA